MSILPDHVTPYPSTKDDRILFWGGLINVLLGTNLLLTIGPSSKGGWVVLIMGLISLTLVYMFQGKPTEHSKMSEYLDSVQAAILELDSYLKRERERIDEAKETYEELTSKHDKLKPVVDTDQETVEAVLSAFAATTRKTVWKDRAIGFVLGIAASILASLLLTYLSINLS